MYRWFLIGMLSCLTAMVVIIIGIGEVMTGPASTAVDSLTSDFPAEPVQIPLNADSSVHGWMARGSCGGVVLLVRSIRSNRLEMLSRARFLNKQGYSAD
jgi:hypothetical protein